jgi:hypothetical protein
VFLDRSDQVIQSALRNLYKGSPFLRCLDEIRDRTMCRLRSEEVRRAMGSLGLDANRRSRCLQQLRSFLVKAPADEHVNAELDSLDAARSILREWLLADSNLPSEIRQTCMSLDMLLRGGIGESDDVSPLVGDDCNAHTGNVLSLARANDGSGSQL